MPDGFADPRPRHPAKVKQRHTPVMEVVRTECRHA
jgi:hypothetical protein